MKVQRWLRLAEKYGSSSVLLPNRRTQSALTFIHLTIRDPNKSLQPGASSFFSCYFFPVGVEGWRSSSLCGTFQSGLQMRKKTQLCIQGLTLMSSGASSWKDFLTGWENIHLDRKKSKGEEGEEEATLVSEMRRTQHTANQYHPRAACEFRGPCCRGDLIF